MKKIRHWDIFFLMACMLEFNPVCIFHVTYDLMSAFVQELMGRVHGVGYVLLSDVLIVILKLCV